ncbi:MAG: hypothetical protein MUQ00_10690 [Candidatus Aminicenantes bacterium]|nr:hypothetical protein [Candidatus Aminicenantes bacterium]
MNEKNRETRVGSLVANLPLLVFLAALLLGPLQGAPFRAQQPQPPKAKPTGLTFGQREARGMDEIVTFLRRIGNNQGADLISDWRTQNKIRAEDTPKGSASYDRSMSYVALSPAALQATVDAQGNVNMGALFDLTGSLVHEMIHSGQGVTFWAVANYKSQNQAERDAYFGTLVTMALWMDRLQLEVDAKAGKPPCDSLKEAKDLKEACSSFLKYDYEIQQFSKENRPALEARVAAAVKPLQAERDKLDRERSALRQSGALRESELKEDDDRSDVREAWIRYGALNKQIASIDAQIAEAKEELDQPVFDVNSFTWTDSKGGSLTRQQVLGEVQARIKNMDSIARRCDGILSWKVVWGSLSNGWTVSNGGLKVDRSNLIAGAGERKLVDNPQFVETVCFRLAATPLPRYDVRAIVEVGPARVQDFSTPEKIAARFTDSKGRVTPGYQGTKECQFQGHRALRYEMGFPQSTVKEWGYFVELDPARNLWSVVMCHVEALYSGPSGEGPSKDEQVSKKLELEQTVERLLQSNIRIQSQ